jgi:Transposase DDE domain group 1
MPPRQARGQPLHPIYPLRPRGRLNHAPLVRYRRVQYQAASWDRPRRVIAKVEHHLEEIFPRIGFIVTTLTETTRAVVHC